MSTSGNVGPPAIRKLTYDSGLDHENDSFSVSAREPSCATLKQLTSTSLKLDKKSTEILVLVKNQLKAAELKGFESFNPSQQDLEIFEVEIEKSLRNQLRNEIEPGYYNEEGSDGGDSKDSDYAENSGIKRKKRKVKNPAKGQEQASKVY